jgi:midasin
MDNPNNWDALSIPFQAQIDQLLIIFPDQLAIKTLPTQEKLIRLSNLLKNPIYAIHVARLFSPLLVDLCARWLDDEEQDEAKFAVFSLLVPAHEELYPYDPFSALIFNFIDRVFSVLSQFLCRPSLANGPLGFITKENVAQIPLKTLHVLLLAYHRLVEACCYIHEEFHWPSSHLQCLFEPPHPDVGVRLLAIRCFAFHVGMNEPARVEMEETLVGSSESANPFVDTGFGDTLDVWVLPILDSNRIADERMLLKETFQLCRGSALLESSVLRYGHTCLRLSNLSPT